MALARGKPDEARQQIGTARVDDKSPLGERPDEPCPVTHQYEVAGQRQVCAGTDRSSVDRGHGRLVELPKLADERLHAGAESLARAARVEAGLARPGDRRLA